MNFAGKCFGGPHDGKFLGHILPRYSVAVIGESPLPRVPRPNEATLKYKIGTYDYDYDQNVWRWSPPT